MRPVYIWQYPDWPNFRWDKESVITPLAEVRNWYDASFGF